MRRLKLRLAACLAGALAILAVIMLLTASRDVAPLLLDISFHRPGWDRAVVLVEDQEVLQSLAEAIRDSERLEAGGDPDPVDLYVLRLRWPEGTTDTLWMTASGRVFEPVSGAYLDSPHLVTVLSPHIQILRRGFFGELVPWGDVHRLFHYDSEAEIEDLETGRIFRVFRYGGIDHADMEPLTALDAAIMKGIYGGDWSWRRRAVILHLDGRRVAASMTGMPHMGQKITGNDFEGHFCLHLDGSVIHGPRNVDVAHSIMWRKAAGLIDDIVSEQDPGQLAVYLVTSLGHGDGETALAMLGAGPGVPETVSDIVAVADGIYADRVEVVQETPSRASVIVSFSLHIIGHPGDRRLTVTLDMERSRPGDRWIVDPGFLESLRP